MLGMLLTLLLLGLRFNTLRNDVVHCHKRIVVHESPLLFFCNKFTIWWLSCYHKKNFSVICVTFQVVISMLNYTLCNLITKNAVRVISDRKG